MTSYKFDPDWVVHPGGILRDWIEERHLSVKIVATLCGRMEVAVLQDVLDGECEITPEIAEQLAWGTNIPARFWLSLEHNFRVGLAAGKKWTP